MLAVIVGSWFLYFVPVRWLQAQVPLRNLDHFTFHFCRQRNVTQVSSDRTVLVLVPLSHTSNLYSYRYVVQAVRRTMYLLRWDKIMIQRSKRNKNICTTFYNLKQHKYQTIIHVKHSLKDNNIL